ncbi:MAG: hypothetical protein JJE04_08775 [Acidobacteriia bacterium]|nr:hypothetical protein [Terriglobia bacterium]
MTPPCPVSERAACQESIRLPQFLLPGDPSDVHRIAEALALLQVSRTQRPGIEKKND